jgi:hypothetical protein
MAFSRETASRRSPVAVAAFRPSRFFRLLLGRTKRRRSAPFSKRALATCEPRNPVAPVTNAFKGRSQLSAKTSTNPRTRFFWELKTEN